MLCEQSNRMINTKNAEIAVPAFWFILSLDFHKNKNAQALYQSLSVLWLRATNKIFLPFSHMTSNSCKNEILADARMKSANADEIFGFASDEIKSTHSPSRRISSNEVGFHCRRRFHPPVRVDLVEKDLVFRQGLFLWYRV